MNAQQKQNKRRAGLPRLPSGYLTYPEYVLLERLAAVHGSKKAAILEALKLLEARDL